MTQSKAPDASTDSSEVCGSCCDTMAIAFVKHPRKMMSVTGLLMAIAAGIILGLDLFAFTEQNNDDFMIKGRVEVQNRDAVRQAEAAVAVNAVDSDESVPALSERESNYDFFILVEDTQGDDITHNDALLRDMQVVVDRIIDDPGYTQLCHKPTSGGGRCAPPTCILDFQTGASAERMSKFVNNSGELQSYPVLRPGQPNAAKDDVLRYYLDADASVRNQTRVAITANVEASVPAGTPNRSSVVAAGIESAMEAQEPVILASIEGVQGLRSLFLDRSASATNKKSKFLRCMFPMGAPLPGFRNNADRQVDQLAFWDDTSKGFREQINNVWFFDSDRALRPTVFSIRILQQQFAEVSVSDMVWAAASILFVFGYLCFHTGSFFVAGIELIQILCSMPLALLVYKIFYGIDFFQTLHSLSVFIILGIGCDAVFIFVDAWNQAPVDTMAIDEETLIVRMRYTYRRASKALFVTSFTTFAAFLATGASEIMPIATFGFFAGTLVAMNFFLDIIFLPAVLVIWERSVRPWERRCCSRCCETPEVGVKAKKTDDDSAAAASAAVTNPAGAATKAGTEETGGSASAKSEMDAKEIASAAAEKSPESPSNIRGARSIADRIDTDAHDAQATRAIEICFRDRFTPAVYACRVPIFVIGLGILGFTAYATSLLAPLSKQEEWFPTRHFIGRALEITNDHFGATENDRVVEVKITWGVKGIDRTGTNPYRPGELGTVVWDTTFEAFQPEVQSLIHQACADAESGAAGANAKFKSVQSCWPRTFATWLESEGAHFPVVLSNNTITGTSSLPGSLTASAALTTPCGDKTTQKELFECALGRYIALSASGTTQRNTGLLGIDKADGSTLRVASIELRLDLPFAQPYATNKPILDAWEAFATDLEQRGADINGGSVIQTAGISWAWMQTERALVTSALMGIAIAVSVALVVLVVSTNSVPVGLFATLTIGGIVLTVLATMVALGWELGTTESVSSVILIGFSVDYTVHIANAYQEAGDFHHDGRPKTRLERVRSAIAEYGVSIVAGGMTTLLAGFPLFMGTIAFFSRFATLICTSIAASLVWALTFLPATLMLFGPEDSVCTLTSLFQCRLRPVRGSGTIAKNPSAAAIHGTESTAKLAVAPASSFKVSSAATTPQDTTKPAAETPTGK